MKNKKLASYFKIAKNMASMFQDFDIKQVPREDNAEADALSNLGYAFKIHPDIKIPIYYVITPII